MTSQSIQKPACVSQPSANVIEKITWTKGFHGQRKMKKRNSAMTWMIEMAGIVIR